jgi:hypothetical protein
MSQQTRAGTAHAEAGARYLAAHGFPYAERRVTYGRFDRGDITGVPGITLEFKAEKGIDLATGMSETYAEQANNTDPLAVLVNKGRGKGIHDAYATMPFWMWAVMARLSGYGKPLEMTPELQRTMAAAASKVRLRPEVGLS